MTGFHQFGFAHSTGLAISMSHSEGWVQRRDLYSPDLYDLISPYPVFASSNFTAIRNDFNNPDISRAVSLTLRTDALDEESVAQTKGAWDWFKPFKTHYISDLSKPWRESAGRNAIRYERQARQNFDYSTIGNPVDYAVELQRLNMVVLQRTRGHLRDAMDIAVLRKQLGLSGVRLFAAFEDNIIQALGLFMLSQDKAYAYLLGCLDEARDRHVIYGLYGYALDELSQDIALVDFGGAPGLEDNPAHPVAKFKQLWTSHKAQSYICGKIFNAEIYESLSKKHPVLHPKFFPRYHAS